MSVVSLKELSSADPSDHALLDLFQKCRENVLQVSTSPSVPDYVIVTTQCGFIELIEIQSGVFRLFVTHLNHIPLDIPLKCFALSTSLFSLVQKPFLLFSLAYSNELLLSNMSSGTVDVLGVFETRPSVVVDDGDFIFCGESGGRVSAWRSDPNIQGGKPHNLWTSSIFEDKVTFIKPKGDCMICFSADFECTLVDVKTGAALQNISYAAEDVNGVLLLQNSTVLFSQPSRFLWFKDEGQKWQFSGSLSLDTPICCVTALQNYLATGSMLGVVLLFEADMTGNEIKEIARFDVGYGVVLLQLYENDTLLVVTTAGDVWRWSLQELLQTVESENESEEEEDESLPVAESPPCPTVQEAVEKEEVHLTNSSNASVEEPLRDSKLSNGSCVMESSSSYDDKVDVVDDNEGIVEDFLHSKETNDSSSVSSTSSLEKNDEEDSDMGKEEENRNTENKSNLASCTSTQNSTDVKNRRNIDISPKQMDMRDTSEPPSMDHSMNDQNTTLPPKAVETTMMPDESDGDDAVYNDPAKRSYDGESTEKSQIPGVVESEDTLLQCNIREEELIDALSKKLDVIPEIAGLKRGPRMDPRQIAALLTQQARNNGELNDRVSVESFSTQLLLEQRENILQMKFDFEKYAEEHPMEMEALPYTQPVRMPVYGLQDRLFDNVTEALKDKTSGQKLITDKENVKPGVGPVQDELADALYPKFTRKKIPELEEERRRGGPNIFHHSCDDLLYTRPPSTVLFTEYRLKPSQQPPVLLSLPLPPTPSMF